MNTEPSSSAPGLLAGRSALLDGMCPELDRRPAVAVITGEAGAGKSRFVQELLRRTTTPDAVTLVARCQEADTPFPFAPLVEALNRFRSGPLPADLPPVTGALHALLPDLAHRLPPAPPPLRDPRAEHRRVLRALNAYTAALGEPSWSSRTSSGPTHPPAHFSVRSSPTRRPDWASYSPPAALPLPIPTPRGATAFPSGCGHRHT
ncbi:AAA ATPase domain-containing protein [Streptomyces sp. Termitarium-T10T-6]|nr:ATP-binding protein [Streptomyces sp. Termitarium-T10T-6]SCE60339.1 AAA ATPase domain-containing protein [Streptomyces sp. Termitarium-T10T-6]